MTYPGTKPRVPSAIESSLISRVTELERERDELVEALRKILWHDKRGTMAAAMYVQIARNALAKHGSSAEGRE